MSSTIHGVLFDKTSYTPKKAEKWLKDHNLKAIRKMNVSEKYLRFRITIPDYNKYYYYTKKINDDISIILEISKNKPKS